VNDREALSESLGEIANSLFHRINPFDAQKPLALLPG
jgi:hypothetical protein